MKMLVKFKYLIMIFLSIAYAVLFSLGVYSLLMLMGLSMAISFDGINVVDQYPRFIPFCFIVGILSLFSLLTIIWFQLKRAEQIGYDELTWAIQLVLSFLMTIPLLKVWEMLFAYLRILF